MKAKKQLVSLGERLEHGYITVAELCQLKCVGQTKLFEDIKQKRLPVTKCGRSTRIAGPVAVRYVPGKGLAE
jgi:hypothetical protein